MEFAADLHRFLRLEAVSATRPSPWRSAKRVAARYRRGILVGMILALFVGLSAIGIQQANAAQQNTALTADLRDFERRAATAIASQDTDSLLGVAIAFRERLPVFRSRGSHLRDRANRLQTQVRMYGATLAAQADTEINRVLAGSMKWDAVDQRGLLAEVRRFTSANSLLPDSPNLQSKAQASHWYPQVSIQSDPPGAQITFQSIEWVSGEFQPAEPLAQATPLRGFRIPPGRYRITLSIDALGFVEITRWFGEWNRHYDLGTVLIRPLAEVQRGMILHSRSEQDIVLPLLDPKTRKGVRARFAHAPFYLERTEVSNERYSAFLANVGNPLMKPGGWQPSTDPAWLTRPVVGVSWTQARSFAEWDGKRLPTEIEWMRATTGSERRKFPWGNDEAPIAKVAVARDVLLRSDRKNWRRLYMQNTVAVDHPTDDQTPEGVLHLAGNVSEWTGSVAMGALDNKLHPLPSHRRSKGWNWSERRPKNLRQYEEFQLSFPQSAPIRGFRCAMSAAPTPKRKP